jgi:hypothetical protein
MSTPADRDHAVTAPAFVHRVEAEWFFHAAGCSDDRKESALANDQAQIVRLLEALNEGDPVQILRRSLEHDALDWVERGLSYGAGLGLGPEIATPLLFQTLNEIRAVVADRIERERAEARPRRRWAGANEPSRRNSVIAHAMPA